ncbi:MAG: molybdopterin molybdenumtransferase MoeA [Microbacteriaceae bacterium]|jgi:molybdopterin molybdotransferase|nr:molybdopterin molybdenumtransferase MoeA [Mycetocola sp.]MCU1542227.1 molybdopterin molybdenumtransferase MoeA [Microbacteriaceae bacterium]
MESASVDDHAAYIRSIVSLPTTSERVPLALALCRVTVAVVHSPVDLPLFPNSQMDGFAVRSSDLATGGTSLPIVGEVAARPGTPPPLEPGTTVRIMTGAVIPDGADAIVPVEDTTTVGDTVTIHRHRAVGEYVRERGSDVRTGEELLPAGLRLASRHLAVLAAAGLDSVDVRTRVRVAVITTGAELVVPGAPVELGQVYDSNAVALDAAVRASGGEVIFAAHNNNDDVSVLGAVMLDAADRADIILTSGGISMGDYEVVRDFLVTRDGRVGHIAMQPGGPQATGSIDGVPIIGFPGNPVSTQISFEVFVAPLLREAAGLPPARRSTRVLTSDVRSIAGKRQFLRGRTVEGGRVEMVAGPGSHLVASLAASDVLIDVPEGTTELKAGDTVETIEL